MPNELAKKGAQPGKAVRYAVLWNEYFYDGLVTQRNPLRGNASHIETEFYGARQDTLIDGLNTEISSKLTLIRRPGETVYNSSTFPTINRFYENRTNTYNSTQTFSTESIQVVADTASTVYDCTGPSTDTSLFTKTTGAQSTYFQSVGNSLYFSDGPDQKKLLTPSYVWGANQSFSAGQWILDTNGNVQEVQASYSLNITTVQVEHTIISHAPIIAFAWVVIITFSGQVEWKLGTQLTFTGMTNYPFINGQTLATQNVLSLGSNQVAVLAPTSANYGPAADTGSANSGGVTGSFTSGATQPAWNTSLGGNTTDGSIIWTNFGTPLYNWADAGPTAAPTVTPNPNNRQWLPAFTLPDNNYSILDSNNNVQLSTGGTVGVPLTTGNTVPVWGTKVPTLTNVFVVGGTTATTGTSFGSQTNDGNFTWINCGPAISWGSGSFYPQTQVITDSNGNWQLCNAPGVLYGTSGSTEPTWATTVGTTTADGDINWVCIGPGGVIISGAVQYAYSLHSVDGSVTTASPIAPQNINTNVVGSSGNFRATVTGVNSTDPQIDQIWIWRTVQGGSTLFFLASIPNPDVGTLAGWSYTDFLPDTSLDELIEAPIDGLNSPPPVGITALAYHLGCIFGAVGNTVPFSQGPFVTAGNGNTAWSASDVFIFPSSVRRLFPTSSGLVVFTTSDIYIIQGTNTASSPLYSTPFLEDVGLLSYDAFDVNGSIVHLYTSDNCVITLDPSSGVSEIGFPIGDQFGPDYGTGTFNPNSAHLTWHIAQSQDKGLYVSDFQGTWWRMCPTPSPETGTTWSPKAQIVGGFSAVQSVETSPGTHNLLLGPLTSGPILQRNYQVYSDNGSAYSSWAVFGSLVLAQPGQLAIVESLTTDSMALGTPLSLAVQLDEISSYSGLGSAVPNAAGNGYAVGNLVSISGGEGGIYKVSSISGGGSVGPVNGLVVSAPGENYPASQTAAATTAITGSGTGLTVNTTSGGLFENLVLYVPDPTELEPSITLNAQRFYLSQTQLPAVCRHLQVLVNFANDTVKNELLSLSLFGAFEQEK